MCINKFWTKTTIFLLISCGGEVTTSRRSMTTETPVSSSDALDEHVNNLEEGSTENAGASTPEEILENSSEEQLVEEETVNEVREETHFESQNITPIEGTIEMPTIELVSGNREYGFLTLKLSLKTSQDWQNFNLEQIKTITDTNDRIQPLEYWKTSNGTIFFEIIASASNSPIKFVYQNTPFAILEPPSIGHAVEKITLPEGSERLLEQHFAGQQSFALVADANQDIFLKFSEVSANQLKEYFRIPIGKEEFFKEHKILAVNQRKLILLKEIKESQTLEIFHKTEMEWNKEKEIPFASGVEISRAHIGPQFLFLNMRKLGVCDHYVLYDPQNQYLKYEEIKLPNCSFPFPTDSARTSRIGASFFLRYANLAFYDDHLIVPAVELTENGFSSYFLEYSWAQGSYKTEAPMKIEAPVETPIISHYLGHQILTNADYLVVPELIRESENTYQQAIAIYKRKGASFKFEKRLSISSFERNIDLSAFSADFTPKVNYFSLNQFYVEDYFRERYRLVPNLDTPGPLTPYTLQYEPKDHWGIWFKTIGSLESREYIHRTLIPGVN